MSINSKNNWVIGVTDILRKPEFLATFSLIIFLAIYYLMPNSFFETDDDPYFLLNFSGRIITNEHNIFVIHINTILGSIFSFLYKYIPGIAWYGYTQIFFIFFSIYFIAYTIYNNKYNHKFILSTIVLLFIYMTYAVSIQFTKTAFLSSTSGLLGILTYLNTENKIRSRFIIICSTILLLFGASLRIQSFFLSIIILCPAICYIFFKSKNKKIFQLLTILTIVLSFIVIDNLSYDKDSNEYKNLSKKIAYLINFNKITYENNSKIFDSIGWSSNDFYMLKDFGYADPTVYSMKNIDTILNKSSRINDYDKTIIINSVKYETKYYILMILFITIGILLASEINTKQIMLVIAPLMLCVGLLYYSGRMPARITICIASALPITLACICTPHPSTLRRWGWVLLLLPCLYLFNKDYERWRFSAQRIDQFRPTLVNADLISRHSDYKIIVWGPAFGLNTLEPFKVPTFFQKNNIVWLSMLNLSPLQRQQLSGSGNVFTELLNNKNTLIAMSDDQAKMLKRYYVEHMKTAVTIDPQWNLGAIVFYRVTRI